MNEQNLSNDIKTELKNSQQNILFRSIIPHKYHFHPKNSSINLKNGFSKIDHGLYSPGIKHTKTKFGPKDYNIQCSGFDSNILSSEEEEDEEMGKAISSIGVQLKQRIIGMGVEINKKSSKSLDNLSSENLETVKSLIKVKKKKNKKVKQIKKIKKYNEEESAIICDDLEKYRTLKKIKNIFDSMDEEELINDLNEGNILFELDSNFIFIFDSLILFSSLFSFFYLPILIAKSDCFCINENIFIKYLKALIEVLYYLDIAITFFRGYYNYEFKLNKNNKQIAIHYLKTHFKYDLLEAIPFFTINNYLCSKYTKYKPDGSYCLYNGIDGKYIILKLLNCLKIMKIEKAISKKTNVVIYKLFYYVSENSWGEKYLNILKIFLFCILGLNVFVCIHIFVGKQSYPNWILLTKQQDAPFSSLYISSLYFLIETLTTVGYGDIYCSCLTEIIFQILLLSVGIIAYSYLITIIGNYFKNETRAQIKHEQKLTLLEEIRIEYPKMPFKLYRSIHQHLKSLSHQQKKCDFNILVNSLPYSIKNLLLFKVYDSSIKNFHFLKNCDNSDFISKVLTCFIPVFSKKNAFIIHEDEIVENIVFVKEGSLSLKVAINLHYPEESIRKILYEKFVDIPDTYDHKNSVDMNNPIKNQFQTEIEDKNAESAISNKQASLIDQEIGKVDLGCEEDLEDGNYQFLKILNISKNDNYGMIYMFLNKPSPLSLRVRSKKADIFLLRKHDAYKIAKAYPNIWKKQFKNSYHNMISIKKFTFKVLEKYCALHNIIITKTQTKETGKIALSKIQEMIKNAQKKNELKEKKKEEELIKSDCSSDKNIIKSRKSKKFGTSLHTKKTSKKMNSGSINKTSTVQLKKHNEEKFQKLIKNNNLGKCNKDASKKKLVKAKSLYVNKKSKFNSSCENDDSSIKIEDKKFEEVKTEKNENTNKNINEKFDGKKNKDKIKLDKNTNTLKNFREKLAEEINIEIKRTMTEKFVKENNKDYYKLLSMKLTESLNKLLEAFNQVCKNKTKTINNINNIPIISTINTYLKLPDSIVLKNQINRIPSLFNIGNSFSSDKLSISKIDSFKFKQSYKNINKISRGRFINNKLLQDQTKNFIKSLVDNITKISYNINYISTDLNDNGSVRSSSVKPLKSDIYKNINLDLLKQKKIINEISTSKRRLTNKSFSRFNKFTQKNNLTKINKILNNSQIIDKQNNNRLQVPHSENNLNVVKKTSDTEIEYEFPNSKKKEIYNNISDILDENRETKKEIKFKRSNVLEELIDFQNNDNILIDEKLDDDTNKKNIETNDQIKEVDIRNSSNNVVRWNKRCIIY